MLRIEKLNTKSKVYDITVEDNHNFYANDILVHNCSEIMEYTDADTTAICTLSSFPVQNFYSDGKFQWKEFQKVITRSVTALNKVIDENKYTNPEGEKGGKEQRALGLGIQGLADLFHKMKISFTSPEAFETNKKIYEALYYYALRASCDISKREFIKYCKKNDLDVETTAIGDLDKDIQERITYKGFKGSPFSKGILQYDMWGKTDEVESTSDFKWAELKADIVKYGIRNSLLTTQMPTACQTIDTEIRTYKGIKSFKELITENYIDYNDIILNDKIGWYDFNQEIFIETLEGLKPSTRIYYNGIKPITEIEMEDGTLFKATSNHKFLINRDKEQIYVSVEDLIEGDDIVNIFE